MDAISHVKKNNSYKNKKNVMDTKQRIWRNATRDVFPNTSRDSVTYRILSML